MGGSISLHAQVNRCKLSLCFSSEEPGLQVSNEEEKMGAGATQKLCLWRPLYPPGNCDGLWFLF